MNKLILSLFLLISASCSRGVVMKEYVWKTDGDFYYFVNAPIEGRDNSWNTVSGKWSEKDEEAIELSLKNTSHRVSDNTEYEDTIFINYGYDGTNTCYLDLVAENDIQYKTEPDGFKRIFVYKIDKKGIAFGKIYNCTGNHYRKLFFKNYKR